MKNKKTTISSFNLAFLDIMFCGFGAVVLLVLIINSQIVSDNKIKSEDLTAEVDRVKNKTQEAKIYHRNISNTLEENRIEIIETEEDLSLINDQKSKVQNKKNQKDAETQSLKKHINALQNDIKSINKKNSQKKKNIESSIRQSGNKVRQYEGDGHRQYLTGLKLGGKRVLFLIDSSASMLDETIVNVIVKRNMSVATKKNARKWQQAINSVKWMVANLPSTSQFLIVSFNKDIKSMTKNRSYKWIKSTDVKQVNELFDNLNKLVPSHGTNLRKAFSSIKKVPQKPDNIILVTDGLPTQGARSSKKTKISGGERIGLYNKAIKTIPKHIPINTVLLPMEGDPMATVLFWKLAIDTKGSFITPSRDWP